MDRHPFDALTRVLFTAPSRRALLPLLGSALAAPLLTTTPLDARKKKKKLLKRGATPGACSPPPPGCTPTCGTSCGGDDGCGGACACAAGSLCHGGVCQPCTVVCTGSSAACGTALNTRLAGGGTVYACPGRYVGNFTLGLGVALIGAGKGNDPAVDTILDANGTGRVLASVSGVTATLSGLRLTGGNTPDDGGGILNEGRLTIDDCAIADNFAGNSGGGIFHSPNATGPLQISNSTVADNDSRTGSGLFLANSAQAVTISNCVISGNKSAAGNSAGGGIFNAQTPVTITGSAITGNIVSGAGGGISNFSATVTFDSASSVTGNTAPNGGGGGIYNDVGTVTLNGAEVSGNTGGNCAPPASVPDCVG